MICLEVQSKIIAYIEDKLKKEEKTDFLKHVRVCADCREELDIYYTMIEGMRQLDGNLPLSKDFSKALDERMERELKVSKHKKGFFRYSVLAAVVLVLGFGIFAYVNFLNILHEDEQENLKEAQGEYYFSDTFDSIIFQTDDEEHTLNISISTEEETPTFYEKVRQYKVLR